MLEGMVWANPEMRQGFSTVQHHHHPDWNDLFFDLIFVGCAFRLGKYLKYSITATSSWYLPVFTFLVMFFNMFFSWTHFMSWEARFDTNKDLVHKMLKAVEMFGVVLMCAHIPVQGCQPVSDHRRLGATSESTPWECLENMDSLYATGFSFACIVPRAVQMLQLLELTRVRVSFPKGEHRTDQKLARVKSYAKVHAARHAVCIACFVIASSPIYFGYETKKMPLELVLTCWAGAVVLEYVAILAMYKISYVPANFPFLIHRYGEFVMLMLGEGVLSIVTTIDENKIGNAYHYVGMFAGFLQLLSIQYVYYRSAKFKDD
jgi:low temperature requirement protein LtrA